MNRSPFGESSHKTAAIKSSAGTSPTVAMFAAVIKCLNRHDCRMHDARPNGEGNQAAVFCRIPCSGNQKNAEDQIDTADHLQIVAALATMPDPARRPHEAKRIDQQEGDSGNDKREFQIALSNLVVHHFLLSRASNVRYGSFGDMGFH